MKNQNIDIYWINLSVSVILGIDRSEGSLCIKDDNGKDYLADMHPIALAEIASNMKIPVGSKAEKQEYKKKAFSCLNPERPLLLSLDYPLSKEIHFLIGPYQTPNRLIASYPTGYVAWQIARKYQEIYQNPEKYGIWGHGIEDLFLANFELKSNNVLKVNISS